ncbi:MAG: O-antigen chain length regulator [Proteobacteria bacterium]|nr:O-antigen chain length regulator [Pseudomonadota bacterium]MBU1650518.1 O-antigen chain length regulator [Pseudomonadota bacterium]
MLVTEDGEIDLRELFAKIWASKFLVLVITAFFYFMGAIYVYFTPQIWKANALVIAPSFEETKQLSSRLEQLSALKLTDEQLPDRQLPDRQLPELKIADFSDFEKKKLFADFLDSYNSFDNKVKFLKVKGYIQPQKNDNFNLQSHVEGMAKNIIAIQKKNEETATLFFVADNAKDAVKRLLEYIDFVQLQEKVKVNKQLVEKIDNKISILTFQHQVQNVETLKLLQDEIARTELSLRISKAAGVEDPVENLNYQGFFPIDLGAKALNEKLKILKEIKNVVLLNPMLAIIRLQLNSFQALPHSEVQFNSYHYLQSPLKPLTPDEPKKGLILLMATLIGLLLGMIISLIRARNSD